MYMKIKKRNAVFGRYPCCDLVNNAIRLILNGHSDEAIAELVTVIHKSDGYFHADIVAAAEAICEKVWKDRS